VYDSQTGFLRARGADGTFSTLSYDPTAYLDDYVEANGWQSLWMNDHDATGQIAMLGGTEAFVNKLYELFDLSRTEWNSADQTAPQAGASQPNYYWSGNEPDIQAAYLFAQAGRPDLTAGWIRWLMSTQYNDGPTGLPGNDDGGTMSAWYVFSALGIYPIPGSDNYVISAPRFPRIDVAVGGGVFTIEAPNVSDDNAYVQAVTLDGMPVTTPLLQHSQIRAGSTLHFDMGPQPPMATGMSLARSTTTPR
jgi:predicted alpha-1,2-mannosidase